MIKFVCKNPKEFCNLFQKLSLGTKIHLLKFFKPSIKEGNDATVCYEGGTNGMSKFVRKIIDLETGTRE